MNNNLLKKAEFKPGIIVPVTGIYTVTHDNEHMGAHVITCIKGGSFPTCRTCGKPRFKLFLEAVYFNEHSSLTPYL